MIRLTGLCLALLLTTGQALADPLTITVTKGYRQTDLDDKAQETTRLRQVPGATDLITDDQWQNTKATTVKDIVDYSPGVYAQPRNGAESARLSIRGSGLTRTFQGRGLLVMQDGIPINTADGGFEFPVIDPWLIQYATVLRGANGAEEGASTFGGAIDFITPTGATQQDSVLRAETGSFGTKHGLLSTGYTNGNIDVFAAGSIFSQEGFRDHNQQDTERFNGNFGWHATPHITQRVYVSQIKTNAEIPGAISKAMISSDAHQANPNNVSGDYQRDLNISRVAHRLAWESGAQRFDSTLYYMFRTLDNPVTTYIKENNNDVGWRGKYRYRFGPNHLLLGLNAAYGTADEDRFSNLAGATGPGLLNRDLKATTLESYGEIEHLLAPKLFGIAGAQLSYAQRDIAESFPAIQSQDENYTGFNPRLGMRYDVTRDTQIFTNLSRSFEPPTLDELSGGNAPGFSQLKAQRATTAEIGIRTVQQNIHYDLAYYHGWLRDEFVNYRFADGSTDSINASQSTRDGIELGMNGVLTSGLVTPNDKLTMRNAYSWNRFRLHDDPLYADNQLPGVPEHYLRSEVVYHHPLGFSFGPNLEAVAKAFPIDLTNSLQSDAYVVFGMTAAWQPPGTNWNLYVEGRNLGDRHYSATTNVVPDAQGNDGRYFYPGEGRAVYTGLRVNF